MAAESDVPLVARERSQLADLFDSQGPDAPTLCAGWATSDLVAHLIVREGHPSAAGIAIGPLSGWTGHHQAAVAARPYDALVDSFRSGPPWYSPMRVPAVASVTNTLEFFVHHEDVRRARPGWSPRHLSTSDDRLIWRQLVARARVLLRRSPVDVTLEASGFGRHEVRRGGRARDAAGAPKPHITVTGDPGELTMYLHGRRDHATVETSGADQSLELWQSFTLEA